MRRLSEIWQRMWIVLIVFALIAINPAAAQEDERTETIEALAFRVHSHNLRTQDFTVWMGGELGNNNSVKPRVTMGEQLPGWELAGFDESHEEFGSSDLERPTLLNVWASWCPPCVQEFPHLTEIALAPDEHAFDVLFINSFDEPKAAAEFLKEQKSGIHVLEDFMALINGMVGSQAIPTSILLDADNRVLAVHIGTMTPAHTELFEMIAAHPGVGSFDPADYPDFVALAELQPVDIEKASPLEADETITGTITGDDFQHVYRFEGKAGDEITLLMKGRSLDLEPYLVLLDEDGERLTETTDKYYEPTSVIIKDFVLPADGNYIVVATRFLEADGLSVGDYTLEFTVE